MSWGIVDGSPEACFASVAGHRDIVRRLAVSVFAGGVECLAGEDLAGLRVGGDGLVARVLAALRSGRGLIVAGRAGPPPCIHDAATAVNPIVVNHAPEHLSAMPQDMRQPSTRTRHSFKKRTSFNSVSGCKYVLIVFDISTRLSAQLYLCRN